MFFILSSILFFIILELIFKIINNLRNIEHIFKQSYKQQFIIQPKYNLENIDLLIFLLTNCFLSNNTIIFLHLLFTFAKLSILVNFVIDGGEYIKYSGISMFVLIIILLNNPFDIFNEYIVRLLILFSLSIKFKKLFRFVN